MTRSDEFRAIFDGLAGESVDVIFTIGSHGDPTALGSSPDNVRVERFVPQQGILPACSAVITQGGAGSMLGALTFGCPILFVPQGADQFVSAERAVNAGAGLRLLPREVAPEAIRTGLRRLLDEPSFAKSAMKISNEIADMPPPLAAVSPLERLVRSRIV
ncbi:MAG: nucleotide disphospho-sugar-binding domain-containing protein [Ilumatobacteraceae bacterium]